ncbi:MULTISPECIES: ATP-binding protein [unclassified Pseudomonas]|uniref:ATP-binding protein n=1 Tax=unclassified Pseudomonas TaxID=196821 RepID=UPI001CBBE930|nr:MULTISPECIES: hypothetical protein [unclassified Pseudomonas]
MSNVNIRRAIENIRSGTSVYTPIIESIVNAIQSIEANRTQKGMIEVIIVREKQISLDASLPEITGFIITDNGIGFNDVNRDSFDTLYSAHKIAEGGKGFGRLTYLKYFDDVTIDSTFLSGGNFLRRTFKMGKDNNIIVDETKSSITTDTSGSRITLANLKSVKLPDKKTQTIARVLVEKLLPYFYIKPESLPQIILREEDESNAITLNSFIDNEGSHLIEEIESASGEFHMDSTSQPELFTARVFKLYSPKTQTSKVSLVAHRREVTSVSLHKYIPEFIDEFYDRLPTELEAKDRNFVIKIYVFGKYLDDNVSLERGGFEFQKENDVMLGISQSQIESIASEFAKKAVDAEVDARIQKKLERVSAYVRDNAPWHAQILKHADLTDLPYNAKDEEIESRLQQIKYEQEVQIKGQMRQILETTEQSDIEEKTTEIIEKISEASKNDLVHYVALRKNIIELFEKNLETNIDGKYSSEGIVHDIIFPRRSDSLSTPFKDHNLWLIDERLNFTHYLSSDLPLQGNTDRPDLIAYDKRVLFRGENIESNPVTIFEFKKPQRDDFTNPSSSEDPVTQIIRYVRKIRNGEFKTPNGREILIGDNTPFYGYVICELTKKTKSWLEDEKDFKPMPDRLGYFKWHDSLNLYIEVLGWDKILKDANIRNKIFFHKLGINL